MLLAISNGLVFSYPLPFSIPTWSAASCYGPPEHQQSLPANTIMSLAACSTESLSDVQSVNSLSLLPSAAKQPHQSPPAAAEHTVLTSPSSSSSSPSTDGDAQCDARNWSVWDESPLVRAVNSLFDGHCGAPLHSNNTKRRKDGRLSLSMTEANVIHTADLMDPLQLLRMLNHKRTAVVPYPLV